MNTIICIEIKQNQPQIPLLLQKKELANFLDKKQLSKYLEKILALPNNRILVTEGYTDYYIFGIINCN